MIDGFNVLSHKIVDYWRLRDATPEHAHHVIFGKNSHDRTLVVDNGQATYIDPGHRRDGVANAGLFGCSDSWGGHNRPGDDCRFSLRHDFSYLLFIVALWNTCVGSKRKHFQNIESERGPALA